MLMPKIALSLVAFLVLFSEPLVARSRGIFSRSAFPNGEAEHDAEHFGIMSMSHVSRSRFSGTRAVARHSDLLPWMCFCFPKSP